MLNTLSSDTSEGTAELLLKGQVVIIRRTARRETASVSIAGEGLWRRRVRVPWRWLWDFQQVSTLPDPIRIERRGDRLWIGGQGTRCDLVGSESTGRSSKLAGGDGAIEAQREVPAPRARAAREVTHPDGPRAAAQFDSSARKKHPSDHLTLARVYTRKRHHWAIVANPNLYRVEQAVAERTDDLWTVKRGDLRAGDRVAIWKAKGSGDRRGVVALGEVLTDPAELDEEPASLPYWIDGANTPRQRRVRIRYVRPPRAPLWLEENPSGVLGDLSVARATGGGVYRIEPEQWKRLVDTLGGWPEPADDEDTLIETVQDARARARGQGFSVSPEVRMAVEQHAMRQAEDYFRTQGFQVEVLGKPYDLRCVRGDELLYVEVKGTSTDGEEVLLTPNEVAFARQNASRMVLFVCAGVEVQRTGVAVETSGGTVRLLRPWNVDDGLLIPLGFTYALPKQ